MPPKPNVGRKTARKEENVALSAMTSPYNTITPLEGAKYAWVTHPVTRSTRHLDTSSPEFLDLLKELHDLGIGERISRELEEFRAAIDPAWGEVALRVAAHVAPVDAPAVVEDTTA